MVDPFDVVIEEERVVPSIPTREHPDMAQEHPWIDVRITAPELPSRFLGNSYRSLSLDKDGRLYLANRALDGDERAKIALSRTPHSPVCACDSCKVYTPTTPAPVEAPAAVVGGGSEPSPARSKKRQSKPRVPNPPGYIKIKKASEAVVSEAEAAQRVLERQRRCKELTAIIDHIDEVYDDELAAALARGETKHAAYDGAKTAATLYELTVSKTIEIRDRIDAAWVAKSSKLAERELDDIKREMAVRIAKVERKLKLFERCLEPKLKAFIESTPPEDRSSEKSIRFDDFGVRAGLTYRGDKYEIVDWRAARNAIDAIYETQDAIEKGILKTEISESGLKAFLEKRKDLIPGVKHVPGGDVLTISEI